MTIEELAREKAVLEKYLHGIIQEAVERFEASTGVSVADVSVRMLEVSQIGPLKKQYKVGRVAIKPALF